MSCFSCFFLFKQKTAYDLRISDWSSDVCSSDLFGMVDVAEIGAYGNAALVEGEPCGNQRFIVAGHACRNKKSQNSSRTMIRERARDALAGEAPHRMQ